MMLAVCGTGLTKIPKVSEKKKGILQKVSTALSNSQTWWAFAHRIGPHAFHTLFGSADVPYSIAELLRYIRYEPVPAVAIRQIQERCFERNLETRFEIASTDPASSSTRTCDPSPSSHASAGSSITHSSNTTGPSPLAISIGDNTISVNHHPNCDLKDDQMQQRNIVHWLVETPDTEMVRDTSGAVFRFGVLKSPNEISPELVEF